MTAPTHLIIKQSPDEDIYVEWVRITDTPIFVGTREEMRANLAEHEGERSADQRLERTDRNGCSSYVGESRYGDDMHVASWGVLPRTKLALYATLIIANKEDEARALLQPFED